MSAENNNQQLVMGELDSQIKLAEIMATGKVMIPEHLQSSTGDCMAVIMQAVQWRMNPFVVAQKTFLIKGKLGYEAQLVTAVINTNAPIKDRIKYDYIGDWDSFIKTKNGKEDGLAVRAYAELKSGGTVEKTVYLSSVLTRNSTNWTADPQQQLSYQAAVRLSRQHFPEVILGVYIPDELEVLENTTKSKLRFSELQTAAEGLGLTLVYESGTARVASGNPYNCAKSLQGMGFYAKNKHWLCDCTDDGDIVETTVVEANATTKVEKPKKAETTAEVENDLMALFPTEIKAGIDKLGLEIVAKENGSMAYYQATGEIVAEMHEKLTQMGFQNKGAKGWVLAIKKEPTQGSLIS